VLSLFIATDRPGVHHAAPRHCTKDQIRILPLCLPERPAMAHPQSHFRHLQRVRLLFRARRRYADLFEREGAAGEERRGKGNA
jgi:hypothetical protein